MSLVSVTCEKRSCWKPHAFFMLDNARDYTGPERKPKKGIELEDIIILLVERESSLDHINGVVVLGLEPPIAALLYSSIDIHHPLSTPKRKEREKGRVDSVGS